MLTAVVLVLLGSVTHATWNLVASRARGDQMQFVWVCSVFSAVALAPAVVVSLMLGARGFSWTWAGVSLVSGVLHIAYALLLQRAYAGSDLNVSYPVSRGVGPVLVVLVAVVALGEHVTVLGWVGVATISVGIAVISTGKVSASDHARRMAGLRSGLLVAVAIAAYTLWDDQSVNRFDVDPLLYYTGTGLWMLIGLSIACWPKRSAAIALAREQWKPAALVGVLTPISYVLVLIAMTMAPVSLVAPLRGTSIAIGALAAWLWLGETQGGRRLLGALVVMGGVALMVGAS